LVELLWTNRAIRLSDVWIRGSIGALSGLGLCSAAFSGLLLLGEPRNSAAWIGGLLLLPLAPAAFLIQRLRPNAPLEAKNRGLFVGWVLFFFFGCALAALMILEHQRALPDGGWDAWMIWNRRGRFLVRGTLFEFFVPNGGIFEGYPLLLPGLVALGWTQLRAEELAWPAALSWTAAALCVSLLTSAVAVSRGSRRGLAAGLVLATTPQFVLSAASQEADLWLASFVLAAQVCVFRALQLAGAGRLKLLVLAGCLLGLAGWTKNEGSLFGIALIAGLLWPHSAGVSLKRRIIDALALLVGALPLIALLVAFKFTYARATQLVSQEVLARALHQLVDPVRWGQLVLMLLRRLVHFQAWTVGWVAAIAVAIFLRLRGTPFSLLGPAVRSLVLVGIGFLFVYAISPYDLSWQVGHSADRLLLQCWPSVLFLLSTAWPVSLAIQPST
jgi:Dolichyl-phosphate-mannose-protein mannosyltransferase